MIKSGLCPILKDYKTLCMCRFAQVRIESGKRQLAAMSKLQVRRVVYGEAAFFGEIQDDFSLSGGEGGFDLDWQAGKLVPIK